MNTREVFTCRLCGACCRGQGGIYILKDEAEEAGKLLGLSSEDFTRRFTEPKHGLLSLKTGPEGYCLLRDPESGRCRIHKVKPVMCRDWPFFMAPLNYSEAFENIKDSCPGIHPMARWESFKEFHRIYVKSSPPPSHLYALIDALIKDEKAAGVEDR